MVSGPHCAELETGYVGSGRALSRQRRAGPAQPPAPPSLPGPHAGAICVPLPSGVLGLLTFLCDPHVPPRLSSGTPLSSRPLGVRHILHNWEENPSTRPQEGCRGQAQSNQATDDNGQRLALCDTKPARHCLLPASAALGSQREVCTAASPSSKPSPSILCAATSSQAPQAGLLPARTFYQPPVSQAGHGILCASDSIP